jgi:hypothetical protein
LLVSGGTIVSAHKIIFYYHIDYQFVINTLILNKERAKIRFFCIFAAKNRIR